MERERNLPTVCYLFYFVILVAVFFEADFAAENAVNPKAVGEDEGDADRDDDEEDLESFLRGGGVVNGEAIVGIESGVEEIWEGADSE